MTGGGIPRPITLRSPYADTAAVAGAAESVLLPRSGSPRPYARNGVTACESGQRADRLSVPPRRAASGLRLHRPTRRHHRGRAARRPRPLGPDGTDLRAAGRERRGLSRRSRDHRRRLHSRPRRSRGLAALDSRPRHRVVRRAWRLQHRRDVDVGLPRRPAAGAGRRHRHPAHASARPTSGAGRDRPCSSTLAISTRQKPTYWPAATSAGPSPPPSPNTICPPEVSTCTSTWTSVIRRSSTTCSTRPQVARRWTTCAPRYTASSPRVVSRPPPSRQPSITVASPQPPTTAALRSLLATVRPDS